MGNLSPDLTEKGVVKEPEIPEKIYINLKPVFASLVFTIPRLEVDLPEDPVLQPEGELAVTLKNNGRLELDSSSPSRLRGRDWDAKTEIESVSWHGEVINSQDLLRRRNELLNKFFLEVLENDAAVKGLRQLNEGAGIKRGSYLYRAVTDYELRDLNRDGYKYVSHLDPSANFESESMYQSDSSQVRLYARSGEQDYSGQIIRWKVEDPLLYRTAGIASRRVIPMFTHFLPKEIEISKDGGTSFEAFNPSREETP